MSNYPLPANPNMVMAPEWRALAKIGKVFHLIYLLIILVLLYLIIFFSGFIFLNLQTALDDPEALVQSCPLFFLFAMAGMVFLAIFSLIVWILTLIRMWSTPESIVSGGGIGRTYVVLSIINFFLGMCQGAMQAVDPQIAQWINLVGGILGIIIFIIFLVYMWRLASAVASGRVKSCIRWYVFGGLACIVLVALTAVLASLESPITPIPGIIFCILGLIVTLSYLNSFGYMAKDIKAFIDKQMQEYAEAANRVEMPRSLREF